MKKKLLVLTLTSVAALSALAAVLYDQNITAIYGSGNPDTGWTADTSNGIQLGLRAKSRIDGSTTNATGVYSFPVGPAPRGAWNYEFSINSDVTNNTAPLSTYDYYISTDGDASKCIRYTTVNALNYWSDSSYGNNSTANGQGVEGPASALAATNNVAQNSENITFGDYPGGVQPLGDATYNYELYAVEKGAGPNGARLASVGITVVVGNGGAACATPATAGQCKNDGWMTRTRMDGSAFKNQGDCIQYVNTGK
jgi:hypothetical protein